MMTPAEITGEDFKKGRGYKVQEVDAFVNKVAKHLDDMTKEKDDLLAQLNQTKDVIAYYQSIEDSMKNALVVAEKTSKSTLEKANDNAKDIRCDAREKATIMLQNAETQANQIKDKAIEQRKQIQDACMSQIHTYKKMIEKLESDYKMYREQMRQLLRYQMDMLNDPRGDLSFKIDDKIKDILAGEQGEKNGKSKEEAVHTNLQS